MICELQKRNKKGEIIHCEYSQWDPEPDIIVIPEFDRKRFRARMLETSEMEGLDPNSEIRFDQVEYHRMDELTWVHFVNE